jgi:hypothetical protein
MITFGNWENGGWSGGTPALDTPCSLLFHTFHAMYYLYDFHLRPTFCHQYLRQLSTKVFNIKHV